MPKKSRCTLFWCAKIKCENYHKGELRTCRQCEYYQKCEHCVLQNRIAYESASDDEELKCVMILSDICDHHAVFARLIDDIIDNEGGGVTKCD